MLSPIYIGIAGWSYPDWKGIVYTRRNKGKWFSKAGRDETYNYYYNDDELSQIKKRAERLADAFKTFAVITNNHYRGAELANALELKAMISG